jgi:tight adherence protein B
VNRFTVLLAACAAVLAAAGTAVAAAGSSPPFQTAPIGRTPFPQRGYVLDLPQAGAVTRRNVRVTENGMAVPNVSFRPLAASGVRYGVVLALDASESMAGKPFASALDAARSFVANRAPSERVGVLAFNGSVHVLSRPTLREGRLAESLSRPPALSYGTRIIDAVDASLQLLATSKVSAGAIVLLSDGADVGSRDSLAHALARARNQHVRVFTVALKSSVLDARLLKRIARSTGGSYAQTATPVELTPIYAALGQRLSSEYILQYRSTMQPQQHVRVEIAVAHLGVAQLAYDAPTPSHQKPFHRSLASRFLLSWLSLALLSLLVAGLAGCSLHFLIERTRPRLVERVHQFVGDESSRTTRAARRRRTRHAAQTGSRRARGWLARLEQELEIARVEIPAGRIVIATAVVTLAVAVVLASISPVLLLLAFLVPALARAVISHKLRSVRNEFAEQLPPNLQVLASALRAGHSFLGAFSSAVENAHEPSRRELGRVIADERLGVPVDEAIRRVAERMANRDLEQVALLAELARTTGGNSAEVLDTVVQTLRERADVRRLVRTLTAQGRMSRWILTALPVVTAFGFYALQPTVMSPLLHSVFGQVLLVVAAGMVVAGSLVIQKIVDIDI